MSVFMCALASETEHKEPGPSKMRLDAQRMRSSSKVSIMSAETTASHTTANTGIARDEKKASASDAAHFGES